MVSVTASGPAPAPDVRPAVAKAARPVNEASGGTAETAVSPVRSERSGRSADWGRTGSFRLLRRRGSPPGVVSTASEGSATDSADAAVSTGAATAGSAAGTAAVAGPAAVSGLKYLWGTTITTEVPSQGESANVTRMP